MIGLNSSFCSSSAWVLLKFLSSVWVLLKFCSSSARLLLEFCTFDFIPCLIIWWRKRWWRICMIHQWTRCSTWRRRRCSLNLDQQKAWLSLLVLLKLRTLWLVINSSCIKVQLWRKVCHPTVKFGLKMENTSAILFFHFHSSQII